MTWFAAWRPWPARLLLLLVVALIALAALPRAAPEPAPRPAGTYSDSMLYRDLVERVARGEDYYTVTVAQHRAHDYPTAPPQVFREPMLTWLLVPMGTDSVRRLSVFVLLGVTVIAFYRSVARYAVDAPRRVGIVAVQLTGLAIGGVIDSAYLHEVWAGLLLALSLLCYRPGRWGASLALAVVACLIRELALPFLAAMAAFALLERRWRELAAWLASIAVCASLLAVHLVFASGLYRPGDVVSPGWLTFGGWPAVIATARKNLLLHLCPDIVVAAAICLGVLGLAGRRDSRTSRAALVVGGYAAAFAVVGRPDTAYWGMLYTPILPLGWTLAPAALRDLWRRAFPIGGDLPGQPRRF